MLTIDPRPEILVAAFTCEFPRPLQEMPSPAWLTELLQLSAETPLQSSDEVRQKVRDLLRTHGYKPTGRGKPASEYLLRAAEEQALQSINVAVDACNVVSLHSGLPISVVDLDLAAAPLRVTVAAPDSRYVFNASGQEIDFSGLYCLQDAAGPCANPVKDAQRTKTHALTRQTLSLVWGPTTLGTRAEGAAAWYRALLERCGATTAGI